MAVEIMPTIEKDGKPFVSVASTSTTLASIPSFVAHLIFFITHPHFD